MAQSSYRGIPTWIAEHKPLVLLLASVLSLYSLEKFLVSAASSASLDEWRNDVFLVIMLVMAYFVGFARDEEQTSDARASKAKKAVPHTKDEQIKVPSPSAALAPGCGKPEEVLRAPDAPDPVPDAAPAPDAAAACPTADVPAGLSTIRGTVRSILAQESSAGTPPGLLLPKMVPPPSVCAPPGLSPSPAAGKDVPMEHSNFEQLHAEECTLRQAQENGVDHDTASYSKVMAACNRLNRFDVALLIFQQMVKMGVPSDCQSMNLYVRTRFFKLVAESIDDKTMRESGLQLMEIIRAHGLMPTHLQQNRLICAWKSKPPDELLNFIADIKDQGASLSSTAYRCLMAATERTDPERTLKLYKETVDRRIKLDQVAVNAVLTAYSHLGKCSQAIELFSQMPQLQLSPNGKTYGALIRACTTATRWKEALDFFDTMLGDGVEPNRFACHDAILCCTRINELQYCKKALMLYSNMRQQKVPPSDPTYKVLIKMCHAQGWTQTANEISADRRDSWEK